MRILIGGDIKPTERDLSFFIDGDGHKIFGDLMAEFKNSDFTIANLETPIIDNQTPIQKTGAVFGSPKEILNAIKNLNITFLNLANNHILDHGVEGLNTTINALKDYKINDNGTPNDSTDDFETYNEDQIIINYVNEEMFISEACGFKNIFNDVNFGFTEDTDNWIFNSDVVNNKIENENNAHIHIFH